MVIITHTQEASDSSNTETGFTIEELNDYIDNLYMSLLKRGYKMHEIDAIDIHYYTYILNSDISAEDTVCIDKLGYL